MKGGERTLRNDFAVFILSKGRPNAQITYSTLRSSGYTGAIHILCDNMDDTIDEYRENYGDEVLVFDKVKWSEKSDRMSNENAYNVLLPARNAVTEIAKDLGYKYYMQIDDDISRFTHKWLDDNGDMNSVEVSKMDGILEAMIEYISSTPIISLTFTLPVFYQFGAEGAMKDGLLHDAYNTYLMSVDEPVTFKGMLTEDYIGISNSQIVGDLVYAITDIMYDSPKQGTNEGGLNDAYSDGDWWMVKIYALIANPGNVKLIARDEGVIDIRTNINQRVPKILNEKWRH